MGRCGAGNRLASKVRGAAHRLVLRAIRPLYGKGIVHKYSLGLDRYFWLAFRGIFPRRPVIQQVGQMRMYVYPWEPGEGLTSGGSYEAGTTHVFRRLLRPGMVVVDVGAHVGYYTLLSAGLVGERGKVYAFEPCPSTYSLLLKNIRLNGYENVIAVNRAVSDKMGRDRLFLAPDSSTGHSMVTPHHDWIEMATTSLDEFFRDAEIKVDLIKMDIEGGEAKALQGMTRVLAENPDLVLVTEFNPSALLASGRLPQEFLGCLCQLGFRVYGIDDASPGVLKPIGEGWRLTRGEIANLLCTRTEPAELQGF